jgi:hypothetical protein
VHHGALPALALGYLHGISIGSETRYGLMAYVYAFIGLSILAAVSSWLWHGARNQILARRARDGLIGSKSTIASE